MKTLSTEAMRRRAMALGATLDINGKTFNASRTEGKVEKRQPPPPKAVPAPPPPEPPQPALADQFAAATFSLADSTAQLVASIKEQINAAPKAATPVRRWKFTINRDSSGNMTSIEATAKE